MRQIAILSLGLGLAGCMQGLDKPIIENRYDSADLSMPATSTKLTLGLSTTEAAPPAPGGVAITALSDRAQAALIAATGGKPPLRLKAGGGGETPRVVLQDQLDRTMVVSFRPETFLAPGDRIDAIKVELQVDQVRSPGWKIESWSYATNGRKTIELGTASRERSETFTAETGLKIGGPLTDTSVGFESSRSSSEEAKLTDQNIFDAAVDQNGVAWLEETAGWRESLAHNLSIDVLVRAQPDALRTWGVASVSELVKVEGGDPRPAKPEEVMLSSTMIVAHGGQYAPVCGKAAVTYRVRRLLAGAATFSESDDKVVFERGDGAATFLLAPPPFRPVYGLWFGDKVVSYQIDGHPNPVGLGFASLEEAVMFLDWLWTVQPKAGRLGNGVVGFVPDGKIRPLTPSEVAALTASVVNTGQVQQARTGLAKGCS